MKPVKYQLSKMKDKDIPSVVELFNRNNVYQVIKDQKINIEDFKLTYQLKEVFDFFVLKYEGKVIGTAGFFNYTVLGVPQKGCYMSGYLLIDSEYRTGQAISALHKQIFYEAAANDYGTQMTEINIYNKASLALSKKNGFIVTDDSYEDIHNCISLKSPIIKILKAHKMTGSIAKTYNSDTFKVLKQQFAENKFYTNIEVSGQPLTFHTTEVDPYPYAMQTEPYRIELLEKNKKTYLKYTIKEKLIEKMYVKSNGRYKRIVKKPENGQIRLGSSRKNYTVEILLKNEEGERKLRLAKNQDEKETEATKVLLKEEVQGMKVYLNLQNGSTEFYLGTDLVAEDTFLLADFKEPLKFSMKKVQNTIRLIGKNKYLKVVKTIQFAQRIQVNYTIKKLKKELKQLVPKFGLKLDRQSYWLLDQETGKYQKYIAGIYPSESDDFVVHSLFNQQVKKYYLEQGNKELSVSSSSLASSNQLQMRPLFYKQLEAFMGSETVYDIQFENRSSDILFAKKTNAVAAVNKGSKHKHYPIQNVIGMPSKSYGIVKENLAERTKHKIDVHYQSYDMYDRIKMTIEEQDRIFMNYMKYEAIAIDFDLYVMGKLRINMSNVLDCWEPLENHSSKYEFYEKVELFDEKKQQYVSIKIEQGYVYISREKHLLQVRCLFKNTDNPSIKINYQ